MEQSDRKCSTRALYGNPFVQVSSSDPLNIRRTKYMSYKVLRESIRTPVETFYEYIACAPIHVVFLLFLRFFAIYLSEI